MENPLNTKKPQNEAAIKPPKAKRRRGGLSLAVILSIFGGLLIVGAVVGTLIYSQSAERLTGSLQNLNLTANFSPEDQITTCPEGLEVTSVTDPSTGEKLDLCVCPSTEYPVITVTEGTRTFTNALPGSTTQVTCEPFTCGLTDEEIAKIISDYSTLLSKQGVPESSLSNFQTNFKNAYETWEKNNPDCQPVEPCASGEFYIDRADQCYVICKLPEQYYNSPSILQNAIDSERTDEKAKVELKKVLESSTGGVSYSTWYADTCEEKTIEKQPAKTCEDIMKQLQEAYAKKDKDTYALALKILIENGCITDCDMNFYMAIYSLVNPAFLNGNANRLSFATANSNTAENYILQYIEESCTDCDKTYGLITLYAIELSDLDDADLSLLEKLLQVFLKYCQCVELETLLDSPKFDANDYFNVTAGLRNKEVESSTVDLTLSSVSDVTLSSSSDFLTNTTQNYTTNSAIDLTTNTKDNYATTNSTINLTTNTKDNYATTDDSSTENDDFKARYINLLPFGKAYAQSDAVLSEEVKALIQRMYDDSECGEKEETPECKNLDIFEPTTSASMTITEDFDPGNDFLEIKVDGEEAVYEYQYSTSSTDLELVDTSDDKKKGLKGGPNAGESITIDVVAVDASGSELKQCTDTLTVRMAEEGETPECKDLSIFEPTTSASMTITEDFDPGNDFLEIKVDGEEAVYEYQYSTSSTDLELVDTSDDKKKGLKGGPDAGESITIDVVAVDEDGNEIGQCTDRLTVNMKEPGDGEPEPKVCKSLKITKPTDAQDGSVTLDEDGYVDETLLIEVEDEGEVVDYRFASVSDNDKITFNGKKTLDTTNTAVKLSADLDEGDEYIITVWARGEDEDGNLVGLGDCHDSFTIRRPESPTYTSETPPRDTTTTTISQTEPEPETEELEIPETEVAQTTSSPETTTEPVQTEELHAAAPVAPTVPKSGPAGLIYLLGAGLGTTILTRRRKK